MYILFGCYTFSNPSNSDGLRGVNLYPKLALNVIDF